MVHYGTLNNELFMLQIYHNAKFFIYVGRFVQIQKILSLFPGSTLIYKNILRNKLKWGNIGSIVI